MDATHPDYAFWRDMFALRGAVTAAQLRTKDSTLGTQMKAGKCQIVRVIQGLRGKVTVEPVGPYKPVAEILTDLAIL